jgi:hypothetical protein
MFGKDISVLREDLNALATIIRKSREWHQREQLRYPLHPLIYKALGLKRPLDWHLVVLEWAHTSVGDNSKIAYTQSERKGVDDRQTVTSAGKYLKKHWPDLPDNVIRDLVNEHITSVEGCCKFLEQVTSETVRSVQHGPTSCMKWDEDTIDSCGAHPYETYAAELGWRAAVRLNPRGEIAGRVLVHDGSNMHNRVKGKMCMVRSFRAEDDCPHRTGYSHSDEKLEAWCVSQGVANLSSWPVGTPLARIASEHRDYEVVLPYLDGKRTYVTPDWGSNLYICNEETSGYHAEDTDGGYEEHCGEDENTFCCDVCGNHCDEDDRVYVESEEIDVCTRCIDACFTRSERDGYIRDESVARSRDGTVWHENNDPPEGQVLLEHGRYEGDYDCEDSVIFDIDGESWHVRDIGSADGIVYLCDGADNAGEYVERSDAVQVGDDWYQDTDDAITLATQGEEAGTYILKDASVVDIAGETWHEDREWVAMAQARFTPLVLVSIGTYFVRLHEGSVCPEEACDAAKAILVDGVGWFCTKDVETENIVLIAEGAYALAADLEIV